MTDLICGQCGAPLPTGGRDAFELDDTVVCAVTGHDTWAAPAGTRTANDEKRLYEAELADAALPRPLRAA